MKYKNEENPLVIHYTNESKFCLQLFTSLIQNIKELILTTIGYHEYFKDMRIRLTSCWKAKLEDGNFNYRLF